jgi:hypothetical protein
MTSLVISCLALLGGIRLGYLLGLRSAAWRLGAMEGRKLARSLRKRT